MAFRRYIQRTLKEHGIGITFAVQAAKKELADGFTKNPFRRIFTRRSRVVQVLSCLWRDQGIAQQTLAERIIKDKASLSNLLSNLERKGYVCRREDASDRRNKLVYLTPAGEALWQRLLPILDDVYNQAEQIIGPERIRTLSEELEEIHNRLENA